MLKEKLDSITEHMAGVHQFPENSEHKHCAYAPVDDTRRAIINPESMVSKLFHPVTWVLKVLSFKKSISLYNPSSFISFLSLINKVLSLFNDSQIVKFRLDPAKERFEKTTKIVTTTS